MLLLLRVAAVSHCHWKAGGQVHLCRHRQHNALSEWHRLQHPVSTARGLLLAWYVSLSLWSH